MSNSCKHCQDFLPETPIVQVSCWGCRQSFPVHEKCLHMGEQEKLLFDKKKIWWCPPCLKIARELNLEDPAVELSSALCLSRLKSHYMFCCNKGTIRWSILQINPDGYDGIIRKIGMNLYYTGGSSPCRAVLMLTKALGIELNLIELNLMKKDHLKPDFVQINPQHNVPTLNDNGFVINESRAILLYLAEKFCKDDTLYPQDLKKRAIIHQRLFFDIGTLYQKFTELYYPMMFFGAPFNEEKKKNLDEAFGFLDKFLEAGKWVAGDDYTVADYAIFASVSTADIVGYDIKNYPNVAKWLSKCQTTLPGYTEGNIPGLQTFKDMYEELTKK